MTDSAPRRARVASWPWGELRDDPRPPAGPGGLLTELSILLLSAAAAALIGWGVYCLAEIAADGAGLPALAVLIGAAMLPLIRGLGQRTTDRSGSS